MAKEFIYKEEGYAIRGACFEVYKTLGSGFLEAVYQESLSLEFSNQKIPFISQPIIDIKYKEQLLSKKYIPDFICYDKIILELKAVNIITNEFRAQLLNYLNITGYKVGYLVNFGHHPKIEIDRMVL
ncbi:MAG: GxxExxY protein [Candidatus Marinimicrobia bacterium]|nr:GxxExxY protein [Candidatus Neomarinimicrobiota bacterium]